MDPIKLPEDRLELKSFIRNMIAAAYQLPIENVSEDDNISNIEKLSIAKTRNNLIDEKGQDQLKDNKSYGHEFGMITRMVLQEVTGKLGVNIYERDDDKLDTVGQIIDIIIDTLDGKR